MANNTILGYDCGMNGSDSAFHGSVRLAFDGSQPVSFDRLPFPAPRIAAFLGRDHLVVQPEHLSALSARAFTDIQFRLRRSFIATLARMASDPAGDPRDGYVVRALIENARIAATGVFPICQDTGTASVYGWKGDHVHIDGDEDDADVLGRGAATAWSGHRLRNSQVMPLPDFGERNTGDNSPVSVHLSAVKGDGYRFLFVAKGGGSANKTRLFQETKRLLRPDSFTVFIKEAVGAIGVSACPPYRIAVVLGGQSSEEAALAGKLASAGALDALPAAPGPDGGPYRDRQLETVVMAAARDAGWGAQFGGIFMAHDARVVRLPRHAASLPVVVAVSCSAHRQAYAYISREGYFIEHLADAAEIEELLSAVNGDRARADAATSGATGDRAQADAAPFGATGDRATDAGDRAQADAAPFGTTRRLDLGEPGSPEMAAAIVALRAGELVELWGKAVLVRDAAHARIRSMLERGEALPEWTRLPAYYASPTGTPEGAAVGSIGPTTSRRMDSYLDAFMSRGIFPVTIGKGERGPACREACAKYGGAYLAAIGGAAALAAARYVASCEVIDWPELGMEAIRLVEFTGLPALVAVDSRGTDYYQGIHP